MVTQRVVPVTLTSLPNARICVGQIAGKGIFKDIIVKRIFLSMNMHIVGVGTRAEEKAVRTTNSKGTLIYSSISPLIYRKSWNSTRMVLGSKRKA